MTVIKSFDPAAETSDPESSISSIKGPLIVIIRHGKTEHNKLGLFTGWEDAPLAAEGTTQHDYDVTIVHVGGYGMEWYGKGYNEADDSVFYVWLIPPIIHFTHLFT
jgi:Histidine phosphatase superfamily (branch 1)